MDHRGMVVFVGFAFSFVFRSDTTRRGYHYVNIPMNWTDAQRYCREKHIDLATFDTLDDILQLNRPSLVTAYAWIGLWDDPRAWKENMGSDVNSWKWSATEKPSPTGYSNWAPAEPNYNARDGPLTCVAINTDGTWSDTKCSLLKTFICYDDATPPGQKYYTLVPRWSPWEEARSYCRANHKDLAMVENAQDQSQLMSDVSTANNWIGLYRQPWTWSDRSSVSFKNWKVGQPDGPQDGYCGVENEEHTWQDLPCDRKWALLCYDDVHHVKRMTLRLQSEANLSEPEINQQILQQVRQQILQQLDKRLQKNTLSEVKVKWSVDPKRMEEEKEETNAVDVDCGL